MKDLDDWNEKCFSELIKYAISALGCRIKNTQTHIKIDEYHLEEINLETLFRQYSMLYAQSIEYNFLVTNYNLNNSRVKNVIEGTEKVIEDVKKYLGADILTKSNVTIDDAKKVIQSLNRVTDTDIFCMGERYDDIFNVLLNGYTRALKPHVINPIRYLTEGFESCSLRDMISMLGVSRLTIRACPVESIDATVKKLFDEYAYEYFRRLKYTFLVKDLTRYFLKHDIETQKEYIIKYVEIYLFSSLSDPKLDINDIMVIIRSLDTDIGVDTSCYTSCYDDNKTVFQLLKKYSAALERRVCHPLFFYNYHIQDFIHLEFSDIKKDIKHKS